jgi:hypothetical protein
MSEIKQVPPGKITAHGVLRRNCIYLFSSEEMIIHNAIAAIEHMGADPILTEVSTLLIQARDKLADFVERCDTCDGKRRVKSSNPDRDKAFEVSCPDCTEFDKS